MLRKIRENLKAFNWILWIVVGSFILTIFLVWGRGSVSGPSEGQVATVDGIPIEAAEFYREVDRLSKQEEGKNQSQLKLDALRSLIVRTFFLEAAKKLGLKVSDWAVAKYIESMSAFEENGKFSPSLYESFLKQNGLNPRTFENMVRRDLLVQKVQNIIEANAHVTKFELMNFYRLTFGKRNFKIALVRFSQFHPHVSFKDVKSYYDKHAADFTKRQLQYFALKVKKGESDAKAKLKEAFSLAKSGKIDDLLKPVKDKNLRDLISSENKTYGYLEEGNYYVVFLKKETKRKIPLYKVRSKIAEMIRQQKSVSLAMNEAQKLSQNKRLFERKAKNVGPVGSDYFLTELKVVDGNLTADALFTSPSGIILGPIPTADGFAVVEPVSPIKVSKVEPDKLKALKKFILSTKQQAALQSFIEFMYSKAKIITNPKYFNTGNL